MPPAGSSPTAANPLSIGDVAIRPDPAPGFARRSARFRLLAGRDGFARLSLNPFLIGC